MLIKHLLDNFGFSIAFTNTPTICLKSFPKLFKNRVIECFIQEWQCSLESSSSLSELRYFKPYFEYEQYLDILPPNLRFFLSRMRLSAHSLRIQTGRYTQNAIPRNERFCMCCTSHDIEDVYHFICICKAFEKIRKQYITEYYYKKPSVFKFNALMSTNNEALLINLAKYIKTALEARQLFLSVHNHTQQS